MVFYIKEIKEKILSFLLIKNIEDKYSPFYNNETLEIFCNKIINYIIWNIIQSDYVGLPSFHLNSINGTLSISIIIRETYNKKLYLLGKVILRSNGKIKYLEYILFNNQLKLDKLFKIKYKINEFNKNYFSNYIETESFLIDYNKKIRILKNKLNKILVKYIRKNIYKVYSKIN